MTLPELITVLQAAAEGKTIEAREKGSDVWREVPVDTVGGLATRLARGDILRVKREPRDWWAVMYNQEGLQGGLWATKEKAIEYNPNREVVLVREVLP